MIVREHIKTGGAGDILDYLIVNRELDQSRSSRVAGIAVHNLPVMPAIPKTPEEARELMRLLANSMDGYMKNARLAAVRLLKNGLLHVAVAFDRKDAERLGEICGGPVAVARELAVKVAGKDRAMIFILHNDREHPHVHVLISSTDTRGRAWDSSFDRYRWNNAAREIESKYELSPLTFDPERHSLSPTEHHMLEQHCTPDLLDRMRAAICVARADSPSRDIFEHRLNSVGITVRERQGKDGKVRGWVFNYDEVSVKGSAIHRTLSYRNLTSRLDPNRVAFDPRHEQDVRDVMLLSLADEDQRRAALQHPRASIRYLGMIAEEFRTGRVDRAWDEIDRTAQQRLSARRQLIPLPPQFVKMERAEPVPIARNHIRTREGHGGRSSRGR